MQIVKSNCHNRYKHVFTELRKHLNTSVISDVNDSSQNYCGDMNFLKELGVYNMKHKHHTMISRIVGNIPPHVDNIYEYCSKVFLLVLSVGKGREYRDSMDLPMLYQGGKFISLREGDLVAFNQSKEHALFWDGRVDIAVFWKLR